MKEDLAYTAGIIDGDGHFGIHRLRETYVPRIVVLMTDKKVPYWLKKKFGGNVYKSIVKSKPHWKPRYSWQLNHRNALELAVKLEPYLKTKYEHALRFRAWRAVQNVFTKPNRRPWYKILNTQISNLNRKGLSISEQRKENRGGYG